MINERQTKKYVAEGGIKCPVCGDDRIEGSHIEVDAGGAWQEMTCTHCGEEWQDIYRLVSVYQRKE